MSLDRAFQESQILFGLKQKPNWAGAVWGACQTRGCGNYKKVGEYNGGFCKQCSIRHREDHKKPVLSTIKKGGIRIEVPNPEIRWTHKLWVKDMSDTMNPVQRAEFYRPPKQELS